MAQMPLKKNVRKPALRRRVFWGCCSMAVCRNCATFISPVAPATYLGIGLAGVEIKDHIKYCFGWQWGVSLICLVAGLILGVITF